MADVQISVSNDDLMRIIGMLHLGLDPVNDRVLERDAQYAAYGRKLVEMVETHQHQITTMSAFAALQQEIRSAVQVVELPAEAVMPSPPDEHRDCPACEAEAGGHSDAG